MNLLRSFCRHQLLLAVVLFLTTPIFAQYNLVVAKDGTGNYASVQDAINAAPTGQTSPYVIFIKNGRYREKINIPSNKPFIKLIGEDVAKVILTYNDYAAKMLTCNTTVGTQNSASFTVNANDFSAINITFENSYGDGSQAVTVLVNADRAFFENCRFLGNQDTIYLKGTGSPRNYFKYCYIDGNIDFIFGSAIALFDSCVVYAKSRAAAGASYITAPSTPNGQAYGFVFRDTKFPANTGTTSYFLSRPWASPDVASTRQKAVLLSCVLSSHIQPAGWSIWDANTVTSNLYYAEYKSKYFNNNLADISQRVSWSYQLTQADSSSYTFNNIFGTWNPCGMSPNSCNPTIRNIAISNFRTTRNISSTQFNWNISWPLQGIQYNLYRSSDNINYTSVYSTTSATDTAINFSYSDLSVPASGAKYYYYIAASKSGYTTHITDTLIISNAENIVVNASDALNLCGFSQTLGTPSAVQTYTVSGTNLTGDLIITAPANFEVSKDNLNWNNSSTPLRIVPVSGAISTTTIYVRLNASLVGNYSGNISNTSNNVSTVLVLISGKTSPLATSFLLQKWPLTANNQDSAGVRSPAVTASASIVNTASNRLYTSDGTQPIASPIPAYSVKYGQALGANAQGNSWTNVGSTLNRNYYEEFRVTASNGNRIKVDSITFLSDFYQTTSGIKMGVVYSRNGFTSPADSTEFNSGVGPTGVSLTLSSSGSFTKSFTTTRNDAGPINYYAISLNGPDGVVLNAGETISIRLYWACGSTSVPRFAFLKDVSIKGLVLTTTPLKLISFSGVKKSNAVLLNWKTSNETNINKFIVEKSIDGISFSSIGEMMPNNNNSLNEYSFYDRNMLSENNFYRLKISELDSKFSYSQIVVIKSELGNGITLNSNPVHNEVIAYHEKAIKQCYIMLYDLSGKMLYSKNIKEGAFSTRINLSHLAASVYTLVFNNNGKVYTQKIIKQ